MNSLVCLRRGVCRLRYPLCVYRALRGAFFVSRGRVRGVCDGTRAARARPPSGTLTPISNSQFNDPAVSRRHVSRPHRRNKRLMTKEHGDGSGLDPGKSRSRRLRTYESENQLRVCRVFRRGQNDVGLQPPLCKAENASGPAGRCLVPGECARHHHGDKGRDKAADCHAGEHGLTPANRTTTVNAQGGAARVSRNSHAERGS